MQNYTSDTNAGIIMLLELAAEAETFLGNSSGGEFRHLLPCELLPRVPCS